MAINIQEILHPSDSDSIKFEKINYNFDQILANGGGPVGPKGQKGIQGVVGLTGQKGELGEKGIKGDSGETTSPWKSIAIDLDALDGVNNVTFLKPKPGTDKETPVIWLGDSSFINDGNTAGDGDVTLRSTLNVGRHYNFTGSAIEAEYMTFWHNADNKIVIDSEDQTGYVRYNLSPVNPLVGNAPDIRFQINLPTVHTETFLLSNMGASGTLSDGMIRYNSGGNKFEGYIGGSWKEFCMDPCGSGVTATISISGGDLNLNADGTLSSDSISISGGDLSLNADGTTNSGTTSSTTSSTTTTTAAPIEQQFTIQFSGNGLSGNSWSIASMVLNPGYAGSANTPQFSYNSGTRVGTVTAVAGDTLRFNITASTGLNLEFTSGSPFTVGGGTIISQQVNQNNTSGGLEIEVVLPMTGTTDNVTIEAATQATVYTVSVWEQASHTSPAICDALTSNYTFDYPANLANSGSAFRSYFDSNYSINSGTTRSIKIISSTEPNFQSAGWTVRMDDDNNVDIAWAECSQAPNDFDFTTGQMTNPSGSIVTFSDGGLNTIGVIQGGGDIAINFDSSTSVSQSDFTLPMTFVNWANSNPLTYNASTNTGTLNLDVSGNTGSNANARTGNVTYNGLLTMGNVGQVTIQQDGTVVSGPGGPPSA